MAGSDRYATSAAIAQRFFPAATAVGLATGIGFPDALSAGPELGAKNAPLLLVAPTSPLSGAYATYVYSVAPLLTAGEVFGGVAAVADNVVVEMQDALFAGGAV